MKSDIHQKLIQRTVLLRIIFAILAFSIGNSSLYGEIVQYGSIEKSTFVLEKYDRPFIICNPCPHFKNVSVSPVPYPIWIRLSQPEPESPSPKGEIKQDATKEYESTVKENTKMPKVTVYFDFDSSVLKESEKKKIILRPVEAVVGYTCDLGSKKYNDKLAFQRALSVASFLREGGVTVDRVEGKGKCCYVSEKREENRRVEILYK